MIRLSLFIMLAAMLAEGCGGDDGTAFESLAAPKYEWKHFVDWCVTRRAVDAEGVRWEGRDCGEGEGGGLYSAAGKIASLAAVVDAFAQLPGDVQEKTMYGCAGNLHRFLVVAVDGARTTSTACGSGRDVDSTAGLAEPHLRAAEALK